MRTYGSYCPLWNLEGLLADGIMNKVLSKLGKLRNHKIPVGPTMSMRLLRTMNAFGLRSWWKRGTGDTGVQRGKFFVLLAMPHLSSARL